MSVVNTWTRGRNLLLATLALFLVFGAATRNKEEIAGASTPWRASTSAFDVYLTEHGEFDAEHSAMLASQLPGNKARIISLAPAGALVPAGEVIAEFDTSAFKEELIRLDGELAESRIMADKAHTEYLLKQESLRTAHADLAAQLEIARLSLQKLRQVDLPLRRQLVVSELQEMHFQHAQIERKTQTMRKLFERGFASADELREAEEHEKKSAERVRTAQTRLQLMDEVEFPTELRHSQVQLDTLQMAADDFDETAAQQLRLKDTARKRAAQALTRLDQRRAKIQQYIDQSIIRSPVDGLVNYPDMTFGKDLRRVHVGDAVWRAQPFVIIPDLQSMIVKIRVREVDVGNIAVGQAVRVRPSAFTDLVLPGRIMSIGTVIADEQSGNERRFEVRVALQQNDSRIRPGMTANVRVHTHHYDKTLLIPIEAVFFDSNQSFTFVSRNDGWDRQILRLGGSDGRHVAVLSGLQEGDAIAYHARSSWASGD